MPYKGFISYSHAADGRLAPALQSALQSFAKPWYKLRGVRIFRDQTTLAMTPKLWPSIEAALAESEYFLLLASVVSSRSKWVQREVEYWLENKSADKLLIVVTGRACWPTRKLRSSLIGCVRTYFPAPLAANLPDEEPLYLDLRWVKSAEHLSTPNPRFLGEIAGLLATLSGRPKDELIGEDVKQHSRVRRLVWSAATLLFLLTIASVLAAVGATWQRDNAIARQWIATSTLVKDEDPELSVLFAAQGVAATWRWARAVLPEGEQQLHRAILASHVQLTLSGQWKSVSSVAWSPDGKQLATGSWDSTAKVWDAAAGKEMLTLSGHRDAVFSVAWSPDGKRLATASRDNTAKVWDARTGKELLTLRGHSGYVSSVAWSPDGKLLATGGRDNIAKVWDGGTGKELLTLPGHSEPVLSVAWSPEGKRLATGISDRTAKAWDTEAGKELLALQSHNAAVWSVAWSPDGKRLAAGSGGKNSNVWDAQTGVAKSAA
jgi:WD domain, G-beta repeat/TIR domain